MFRRVTVAVMLVALLATPVAVAKKKAKETDEPVDEGPFKSSTFSGLGFRSIGPALTSGRVSDIAVHPRDRRQWYVAAASGGVWKTENAGTTWKPIFDDQGSYSIGCVTIDPGNPQTVWVGSGENNSQRSVSYGDGVYKSIDGGSTWKKMGLDSSEHIGKILVDPRDSKIVWVAAQGPLWRAGGDRGLYKTIDGGENWELVLEIGEDTGVSDIALDPRDADVIYASAYQRRRRVWTLIDGGPESALYKSTDGGESWNKLEKGLPKVDMGRIGIAVSPVDADVVYAIVEAEGEESGFYRSTDAGSTWDKRSDYISSSPQYYQEIVADPKNVDRVYSLDTWLMVTEDGGKTFDRAPNNARHVDDHALWIDPEDTDYLLVGCDGGVYESFDRGEHWLYKANLPITQFYKVTPDNSKPFYYVYGGTQDNFTLGGPSRSTSDNGILNQDWFVTRGGDGFEPQIDPEDPSIVYSQAQYGGLARYDRRSGEILDIQPQVGPEEDPLRWNWDSALIISPHSPKRLYFAAQRIFRSDDRGDSWKPISGDLTRNLDRNRLEVMGRVQKVDAVAKNKSTSFYGTIVSLSESPMIEGLIYAGTDDGLIQVLEPGGDGWRKIDSYPGVPGMSYVSDVETSRHDPDTAFAVFDAHKDGDFKPYVMRSDDRGRSWVSIAGDLPERGTVYTLVQDHVRPELLFVGTEFGVYFTVDGGKKWLQLDGGLPVIAVRDLEIQRRENDLVAGTFGRGIYILDDYTPLRFVDEAALEREATLFPVKPAVMFMPSTPLGARGKAFQGDALFTAANPPFGAVFTYYLKDGLKSRKKLRKEKEKEAAEAERATPYPTWEDLRAEDREEDPAIVLIVTDADGEIVRRITGPSGSGIHRVAWDLRFPPSTPTRLKPPESYGPFFRRPRGPMIVPGRYTVSLASRVDGKLAPLGEPRVVTAEPLNLATLAAQDRAALLEFQQRVARLQRAVLGATRAAGEAQNRIDHLKRATLDTPAADEGMWERLLALEHRLKDLQIELSGDRTIASRNEPTHRSINQRVRRIVGSQWMTSSAPTRTNVEAYEIAGKAFSVVLTKLRTLVAQDLERIESDLENAGAPWTPGRLPNWTME